MKKDVLIKITGIQTVEGERDSVELTTTGHLFANEGEWFISYMDSEATGFAGRTTVKVGERRVVMLRSGPAASQLIIEPGTRHQCTYGTEYGEMILGVSGEEIDARLDETGGQVYFRYAIDVNTTLASENEVFINIKECVE